MSRHTSTALSMAAVSASAPAPGIYSRLFQALEVPLRSASAPPPDRVVLLLFQDATVSIALLRPAFTEGRSGPAFLRMLRIHRLSRLRN